MRTVLNRWWQPPQFEDENQTRAARLLHTILLVTIAVILVRIGYDIITLGREIQGIWLSPIMLGFQLAIYGLMRKGYARTAGLLFTLACSLAIAYSAYLSNGLFNPALAGQIVVLLITGLVSGNRAIGVLTALNIGVVIWLYRLTQQGALPPQVGQVSAERAMLNYIAFYVVACIVLLLANRTIREALTSARRDQQALMASEQRFRLAITNSPVIISTQDRDLRFTWTYNSSIGTPDSILGKTDADLIPEADAAKLTGIKRRVMESGTGERHDISVFFNGRVQHYDMTFEPLTDSSGKVVGIMNAAMNVTERKQAEQEHVESEILKVELEKERAIGELRANFLTMVSHHFRTPLSIILTSKDLIERYDSRMSAQTRHEHLQKITHQVQYMVKMLEDVLTISKARSNSLHLRPAPVDIVSLCSTLIQQLPKTDREIRLVSDVSHNPIYVDEMLARAILVSLLHNAIQYTEPGEKIRLEVETSESEVVFRVWDNGIGIPISEQEHIFEPFYQGKHTANTSGVGLGLAIAQSVAAACGGTVTLESEEGTGTTFTVRLPAKAAEGMPKPEPRAEAGG